MTPWYPPKLQADLDIVCELLDFALWAFGANGLPQLRVLAFGDISHGDLGCDPDKNMLFCRQRSGSSQSSFG